MNVIIVGGGFAGRWAADNLDRLKRKYPDASIDLFDMNPYTSMLPALPWVVSGDFGVEAITREMNKMLPEYVTFRHETVTRIDLKSRTVVTATADHRYDHLVIACGSVTNYHGFDQAIDAVHKLDSVDDAQNMACSLAGYLKQAAHPVCVIAGGSYTGIELACKVDDLAERYGRKIEIVIVEAAKEVLGLVDEKSRRYAQKHIRTLGFRVITDSVVERFDGKDIRLKTGETFKDAFLCWCTGTKRAIPDIDGDYETLPDKRIIVNEFLQIPRHPEVFVPADTGAVRTADGQYVRKAVNFALYSGRRAGRNICRLVEGKPLHAFYPVDLGEVLPLHDTSAGYILGKFVTGKAGLRLHYFMTGYRNFSTAKRLEFYARAIAPGD
jgi:NADH dehydrogenase